MLIAAGIWGPVVGRLAGITMPLMPFRHLYAVTEPIPELAASRGPDAPELEHPVLRHQDRSMYFRQEGAGYGIGSYRHPELPIEADDLPREGAGRPVATAPAATASPTWPSSPTSCSPTPCNSPRTCSRPRAAGNSFASSTGSSRSRRTRIRSWAPWPDVAGLWVAEAVWVTHGAGVGKLMAEWLVDGVRDATTSARWTSDGSRRHVYNHAYIKRRGIQQYREVYDILHPLDQFNEPREHPV